MSHYKCTKCNRLIFRTYQKKPCFYSYCDKMDTTGLMIRIKGIKLKKTNNQPK